MGHGRCEDGPPACCLLNRIGRQGALPSYICLAERDPKQSKILIYTVRWLRTRPSSILQYTIESRQVRRPAPGPNRSRESPRKVQLCTLVRRVPLLKHCSTVCPRRAHPRRHVPCALRCTSVHALHQSSTVLGVRVSSSHELTAPPIGTIVSTGSEVEGRMPAEGSPRRCGV
jgi:hypothetical protein